MLLESDRTRVHHMLDAVTEILLYAEGKAREDLDSNIPLLRLIERNIEILGEAAARLSDSYRASHPEIPWKTIIGMRNRLAHAYFNLNRDILWATLQERLPDLRSRLESMIAAFGKQDGN